jgi:hypothetical protein
LRCNCIVVIVIFVAIAGTVVAVAVGVVLFGIGLRWARRRTAAAHRGANVAGSKSASGQSLRTTADAGDYYAPTFIRFPGRCFRLCRDADTGVAYPCDKPVAGSGLFKDHRGNSLTVEACCAHKGSLGNWQSGSDDTNDTGPGGVAESGVTTEATDGTF